MNSFINYDLPLKKVFNKISFLARYDMMTDHSDGKMDETTKALIINDYARHRVTGGITLSLSKAFIADLRLNFEKYFYKNSGIPKESERDKIVIEFMTRFWYKLRIENWELKNDSLIPHTVYQKTTAFWFSIFNF